jgi:hypothetical protein
MPGHDRPRGRRCPAWWRAAPASSPARLCRCAGTVAGGAIGREALDAGTVASGASIKVDSRPTSQSHSDLKLGMRRNCRRAVRRRVGTSTSLADLRTVLQIIDRRGDGPPLGSLIVPPRSYFYVILSNYRGRIPGNDAYHACIWDISKWSAAPPRGRGINPR